MIAPMRQVRQEGASDAPRMKLWLTAAAALRHEVDRYDDHLRLNFRTTAVQPEFAAVLLPLPADVEDPHIVMNHAEDGLRLEIRWPGRTDQILWPAGESRRPVVTVTAP